MFHHSIIAPHLPVPSDQNMVIETTIKAGIFIMPGSKSQGMLENLCLKTVETDARLKCVDAFLACVARCSESPRNPHKARAQAYLASMPDSVTSVGLGALKGFWDMSSSELDELKSFLLQL
ncbi:MAG: DUF3226 domain-containing protein [Neobacillus sp.]